LPWPDCVLEHSSSSLISATSFGHSAIREYGQPRSQRFFLPVRSFDWTRRTNLRDCHRDSLIAVLIPAARRRDAGHLPALPVFHDPDTQHQDDFPRQPTEGTRGTNSTFRRRLNLLAGLVFYELYRRARQ
jgi:hypothetical protein